MPAHVIDLHTHYYPDEYVEALVAADSITTHRRADGRLVCRWRNGVALNLVDPQPGPTERIEMMDQLQIATQVLSVPNPSAFFLDDVGNERIARTVNLEFAEIARRHPGRFEGLAMVPLLNQDSAVSVLDEAIDDLGLKGTMLLSNINGVPLDHDRFEPFWEMANDRKLLVYVHPTVPDAPHYDAHALSIAIGYFNDQTLALTRLAYSGVFARYANIRFVFSHMGGTAPFLFPRIDSYWHQSEEVREQCPNEPTSYLRKVVYDTASTHRPALRCTRETIGTDRLIFGSDYPHIPGGVQPFIDALDALEMDAAEQDAVLGERAAVLLDGGQI